MKRLAAAVIVLGFAGAGIFPAIAKAQLTGVDAGAGSGTGTGTGTGTARPAIQAP
jgi:hypothetical protein